MLHLITISHENEITKEKNLVASCVCMLPDARQGFRPMSFSDSNIIEVRNKTSLKNYVTSERVVSHNVTNSSLLRLPTQFRRLLPNVSSACSFSLHWSYIPTYRSISRPSKKLEGFLLPPPPPPSRQWLSP